MRINSFWTNDTSVSGPSASLSLVLALIDSFGRNSSNAATNTLSMDKWMREWLKELRLCTFSLMYPKLLLISFECKEAKWWNVISFLTLEGSFVKHICRSMSSGLARGGQSGNAAVSSRRHMLLFLSVIFGLSVCPFFIQGYFGTDLCNFLLWASSSAKIEFQSFLLQCTFIESFGRIICLLMFGTANTNFPFDVPVAACLTGSLTWIGGGKSGWLLLITDFSRSGEAEFSIMGSWAEDRHWFQ